MKERNLEIVMYHYVRSLKNSRYPNIKGLETTLFKKQIQYLKNHYTFVNTEQVIDAMQTGRSLPDHAMLLTFDDGYLDHYTNVLPVLMEHNIQGFFSMPGKILREEKMLDVNKIHYILANQNILIIKKRLSQLLDDYRGSEFDIPTMEELTNRLAKPNRFDDENTVLVKRILQSEVNERLRNRLVSKLFSEFVSDNEKAFVNELYLSRDQIQFMKKCGMHFGIHGYEHYWFDKLTPAVYEKDILNSLEVFEDVVDVNKWIFCYPYGASSQQVIQFSKESGSIAGVTTEARIANLDIDDPMLLPRFDTNDYPPISSKEC